MSLPTVESERQLRAFWWQFVPFVLSSRSDRQSRLPVLDTNENMLDEKTELFVLLAFFPSSVVFVASKLDISPLRNVIGVPRIAFEIAVAMRQCTQVQTSDVLHLGKHRLATTSDPARPDPEFPQNAEKKGPSPETL